MTKRILSLVLILVLAIMMVACSNTSGSKNDGNIADTVVYGNIYTVNTETPTVEAMAVKDGKIIYTGDKAGAEAYVGDTTEVEDYKNEFIMPGFVDGHVHIYVDAENQAGFRLAECKEQTKEAYLEAIKKYVDEHPDEEVYKGFGWLDNAFIGGTPTKEMLDEVCPDKPMYIKSEDCHSCWINSKMLELTGVTAETENPVGGVIEHDKDGNPNGCFRDTAMDYLVKPYVPSYTTEEYEKLLLNAENKMTSFGYTAYNDVIIDPQCADYICEAYYNLDKAGKLAAKVNASILINNTENYKKDLEHVVELSNKYKGTNFAITDVKIFMDGIVESETAYVATPYVDGKTGADRWPGDEGVERLNDLTKGINDAGLVAHFHAIGDAAITKAIDAIEYARENSTNKDIRNSITHLQMATEEQIKRLADLNIIASSNLGWAPSANEEVGNENIEEKNVGEERNNAMYPFNSMLKAGITMAYATDFPAGPVLDPYYNLQAGITREVNSIESTLRNANEVITNQQAIECITKNGAYQLGHENDYGTLEVGKSADYIVLNQDISKGDANNIYKGTTLLKTVISGNTVYEKSESTADSAKAN